MSDNLCTCAKARVMYVNRIRDPNGSKESRKSFLSLFICSIPCFGVRARSAIPFLLDCGKRKHTRFVDLRGSSLYKPGALTKVELWRTTRSGLVHFNCYKPSSPALQSLISRPHSDFRICEAVIRRLGLGSRIE